MEPDFIKESGVEKTSPPGEVIFPGGYHEPFIVIDDAEGGIGEVGEPIAQKFSEYANKNLQAGGAAFRTIMQMAMVGLPKEAYVEFMQEDYDPSACSECDSSWLDELHTLYRQRNPRQKSDPMEISFVKWLATQDEGSINKFTENDPKHPLTVAWRMTKGEETDILEDESTGKQYPVYSHHPTFAIGVLPIPLDSDTEGGNAVVHVADGFDYWGQGADAYAAYVTKKLQAAADTGASFEVLTSDSMAQALVPYIIASLDNTDDNTDIADGDGEARTMGVEYEMLKRKWVASQLGVDMNDPSVDELLQNDGCLKVAHHRGAYIVEVRNKDGKTIGHIAIGASGGPAWFDHLLVDMFVREKLLDRETTMPRVITQAERLDDHPDVYTLDHASQEGLHSWMETALYNAQVAAEEAENAGMYGGEPPVQDLIKQFLQRINEDLPEGNTHIPDPLVQYLDDENSGDRFALASLAYFVYPGDAVLDSDATGNDLRTIEDLSADVGKLLTKEIYSLASAGDQFHTRLAELTDSVLSLVDGSLSTILKEDLELELGRTPFPDDETARIVIAKWVLDEIENRQETKVNTKQQQAVASTVIPYMREHLWTRLLNRVGILREKEGADSSPA